MHRLNDVCFISLVCVVSQLRTSARIAADVIVDRLAQLKCRKHACLHGREMVAILRSVGVVDLLVDSIASLIKGALRLTSVGASFEAASTLGSVLDKTTATTALTVLKGNPKIIDELGQLLDLLVCVSLVDLDLLQEASESSRHLLVASLFVLLPSSFGSLPIKPKVGAIKVNAEPDLDRISNQSLIALGYLLLSHAMHPTNSSRQISWLNEQHVLRLCDAPIKYFSDAK